MKIFDFGLACFRGCVDSNFLFPGTIPYISPEQIRGDPVDERADIYSLGITVYEMITGRVPFASDDVSELINALLTENIRDFYPTGEEIPEDLHNLVRKATQKEPSGRYQGISEIIEELQPLAKRLRVNPNNTA